MHCPKCENMELKSSTVKGINLELDKCRQCEGIWFDKGELSTLLSEKADKYFSIPKYATEKQNADCPRCNVHLYEFCYPGTMILIDACKQCEGVWLDYSEWKAIGRARDERNKIVCPKCHARQKPAESCANCGIIFAKYNANANQSPIAKTKTIRNSYNNSDSERCYADDIPGIKGSLLRKIDATIKSLTASLF